MFRCHVKMCSALSSCLLVTSASTLSFSTRLSSKTKKTFNRSNLTKASTIDVWEGIRIAELSKLTKRPVGSIIRSVNSGLLGTLRVNADTSIENRELLIGLVSLLGFRPNFIAKISPTCTKSQSDRSEFDVHPRSPPDPNICVPRPPIVAIMGHVDHGKTTLLDALRASRIVDDEFGGITQHLSAFSVSVTEAVAAAAASGGTQSTAVSSMDPALVGGGGVITFIDTPGHAAFSAMRARGARATDIVLLVVAADDGVMPQTVESIKFAKEFGAQIIVAVNKVDKYGVDINRTIQGLAASGVVVEQLGGEIQAVEVSALKRLNLVALLEAILAQAEVMQISADPNGPVEALVLECRTEHGLGKVVNCLVTRGSLRQGAKSGPLVAGESVGCTRVLRNDRGAKVDLVSPGYTATVASWKTLPPVGSIILEVKSDAEAEAVVRVRRQRRLLQKTQADQVVIDKKMTEYRAVYESYLRERGQMDPASARRFASSFRKAQSSLRPFLTDEQDLSLPLIIKADVEGSLEAISDLLTACSSDQCKILIAVSGVGPVTPAEVELASALGAEILAFNIGALPEAMSVLSSHNLSIRSHNIIYRLAEDVCSLINKRLPPTYVEEVVGEGVVLQTFEVTIIRGKRQDVVVGGCRCTRGSVLSGRSSAKHGTGPILYRVLRPTDLCVDHGARNTKTSIRPKTSAGTVNKESCATTTDPLANSRILVDRATCFSLRHGRNDVDSVRRDVEFGIILTITSAEGSSESLADIFKNPPQPRISSDAAVFSDWAPGDVVQCYRIVERAQTVDWHIDYPAHKV